MNNPPETWIRIAGAVEPIVSAETFNQARERIAGTTRRKSNAQLLTALAVFQKKVGPLTKEKIEKSSELPSADVYRRRFGSMRHAFALIGDSRYCDSEGKRFDLDPHRVLRAVRKEVLAVAQTSGAHVRALGHKVFQVNDHFTLRLTIATASCPHGFLRWRLRRTKFGEPDLIAVARMNAWSESILDYFLVPRFAFAGTSVALANIKGTQLPHFCVDSPQFLSGFFRLKTGDPFPTTINQFMAVLGTSASRIGL